MKNPTLADFATAYVENFMAGDGDEKKRLSSLLFACGNHISPNRDFVALAGRSGASVHSAALVKSKDLVMTAISVSDWEMAGANACVHLVLLNAMRSLEDAPAAKAVADAAAKMYALELAENRFSVEPKVDDPQAGNSQS